MLLFRCSRDCAANLGCIKQMLGSIEVSRNPQSAPSTATHTTIKPTTAFWICLLTSLNIRPSHVSPITDSPIKESSQSCHPLYEGCLLDVDICFEGGGEEEQSSYNTISFFLPGEFPFAQWGGKSKLGLKARRRGDQPGRLHSGHDWSSAEGNGVALQYLSFRSRVSLL